MGDDSESSRTRIHGEISVDTMDSSARAHPLPALTPLRVPGGNSDEHRRDDDVSPASTPATTATTAQSGESSNNFINKTINQVLKSPTVLMDNIKKIGRKPSGVDGLSDRLSMRQSVDPYRRAADQAVYRTSTIIHEIELEQEEEDVDHGPVEGGSGVRTIRFGGFPVAADGLGEVDQFDDTKTNILPEKKDKKKDKKKKKKKKERKERKESLTPSGMDPELLKEDNRVTTSKYNVATFLPIFLFEMFTRVAYLYFLIQAGLSWWSVVSPYSGIGATMALVFVLLVAGVKAIWEDIKRHKEDELLNKSITHKVTFDEHGEVQVQDVSWTEIKVGDAVMVKDDENFPADLLCLYSDLPDNVCFIKTTNLDGETNLKIRKPVDVPSIDSVKSLGDVRLTLRAENPNANLHNFKGTLTVHDQEERSASRSASASGSAGTSGKNNNSDNSGNAHPRNIPTTMNEMLLRGCTLKNSDFIVGLVVYAGKSTRIQMNATKTPLKVGSFDRFLNLQISLVILLQMAMCLLLAILSYVWIVNQGQDHTYLALNVKVQGLYSNGFVQIVLNFFTFWILLSYLVPISLFVTLEIVKFWQGFIFINFDKMMKNPATKEHAICRNSNLNEDLGRVEYIFSDKTGTLTSNEMQLRQISIKGAIYGDISYKLEEHPDETELKALQSFDGNLARAARAMKGLPPLLHSTVDSGGSSRKIMAFHSSKPSVGTATDLGVLADNLESGWDTTLGHHMTDFFTNLCLCHSLIIEDDGSYQGPSPDEVALVDAARQLGYVFKKRTQANITLNLLGKEVTYEILNVMEYSSDRGCMSVIARTPDGSVRLYCKGSDTKVMAKIRKGTNEKLLQETNENLYTFACEGLRTLVLGTKLIPEEVYADWDQRYQEASCLFEGREDALDRLGAEVETDLELIGATAIEDKLQQGVPAAIETLLDAGIRIWMITGDKQETAINIAVSCNLVKHVNSLMVINVGDAEDPGGRVAELIDDAESKLKVMYAKETGISVSDIESIPDTWQRGEFSIDGPTLNFVLASDALKLKMAQIVARCSGVVISRSSPSQKAAVVNQMKEYEMSKAAGKSRGIRRWYKRYKRRLQGKMLSIGDGANDVAMIQTADVGIGIMGKEGRQATNSSDYAVSQFRFLVPLLLVHGNLAYYRLARLIKYSFYKNITFAFVMFYYQFYNGYSGQALVDSITAGMFNVVFSSMPILLFAVLDRPVGSLTAFIRYPQLYNKRENNSLSTLSFWKSGVLQGMAHGAVSFFVPYYSLTTVGKYSISDVYSMGKVTFAALLGSITLEAALVARYWTWVFLWFILLSYFLVYPYFIIFPYIDLGLEIYDPAQIGVAEQVLATPLFWFVIFVCYVLTFGSRLIEKTVQWSFFPHDDMILAEKEKIEESKGRSLISDASGKSAFRLQNLAVQACSRPMTPIGGQPDEATQEESDLNDET
jgi:phospholipid-transporting ATPase